MNKHQKYISLKEIGVHAQDLFIIIGSMFNKIQGGGAM